MAEERVRLAVFTISWAVIDGGGLPDRLSSQRPGSRQVLPDTFPYKPPRTLTGCQESSFGNPNCAEARLLLPPLTCAVLQQLHQGQGQGIRPDGLGAQLR